MNDTASKLHAIAERLANGNKGQSVEISYADILEGAAEIRRLREALLLAEDVLSRAPFSTSIWPNGMHPNRGIEKIRAALALSRPHGA